MFIGSINLIDLTVFSYRFTLSRMLKKDWNSHFTLKTPWGRHSGERTRVFSVIFSPAGPFSAPVNLH
jgi:hypothetical protein